MDNFQISTNIEQVKKDFIDVGFTGLKAWYQPANWFYKDGHDFVQKFEPNMPAAALNDEIRSLIAQEYDKQGDELRTFELMIILVTKP